MARGRILLLTGVLALTTLAALGGWFVASRIESPADAAARTAPPPASPILVPVEQRSLTSVVVTRGTARYGLPQQVSVAPSLLKPGPGLITTLPVRHTQIGEGGVLLTASGRPVFALEGSRPAYRDFVPGMSGDDVRQLESALHRLGFHPGPIDGTFDARTGTATAAWYAASGWEAFGPTVEQIANLRALERALRDATRSQLAAASAVAVAAIEVETVRSAAEQDVRRAEAELRSSTAERDRFVDDTAEATRLKVATERARAEHATTAAEADLAAQVAEHALIVLDPRQPVTARAAAEARLKVARAAAERTRLEGELSVVAAEREMRQAAEQLERMESAVELARSNLSAAKRAGDLRVRASLNAEEMARHQVALADERVEQSARELELTKSRLGVQVPVDEIVFIPDLPVRVEEVTGVVGGPATGPVMTVTDNQLSIDSSLPIDSAPLVKPGMQVAIDEQALGIEASGTVKQVASTPGTRGVDGFHFYFEVQVQSTPRPLDGFSLRLTIPLESTDGDVTTVPLSAVSLAADGTSRVQVQREGRLEYVVVRPGLSVDGFVQVTPVDATLQPGDLVVVGYENP